MLPDSVENNSEKVLDKLVCESCGSEFSCGMRAGKCWCFEVELKPESLAELREDFNNCLCQDCLRQIKENAHSSN